MRILKNTLSLILSLTLIAGTVMTAPVQAYAAAATADSAVSAQEADEGEVSARDDNSAGYTELATDEDGNYIIFLGNGTAVENRMYYNTIYYDANINFADQWKTSNSNVIKITGRTDRNCTVEAVRTGFATVSGYIMTCEYRNEPQYINNKYQIVRVLGHTHEDRVTVGFRVIDRVTSVRVSSSEMLTVGKGKQLPVVTEPDNKYCKAACLFSYKSSNTNIVEVSRSGYLNPKNPGTAVVTVTSTLFTPTLVRECVVTVTDNFECKKLSDGTAQITGYKGSKSDIVIPSVYNGMKVTSIADRAFASVQNITSLEIPDSVTSIGSGIVTKNSDLVFYCHEGSAAHKYAAASSIPYADFRLSDQSDSETVIQSYKGNVKNLRVPEFCNFKKVTGIDDGAFSNLQSLVSVSFDYAATKTSESMFENCTSLSSVELPEGLKTISAKTFAGCKKLTEITIPESVTSIADNAFSGSGLKTVVGCGSTAAERLAESGGYIFKDKFLKYRQIDGGWEITGYEKDIARITIPPTIDGAKVKKIADSTFKDFKSLKSVSLPDTLEYIGSYTFENCTYLTSVEIPDSVTSMGEQIFRQCTNLKSAKLPKRLKELPNFTFSLCKKLEDVPLPEGLTSIGEEAFHTCTSLTAVELPKTLVSLGKNAYIYCSGIKTVSLPDSVTTLGAGVFRGCSGLSKVELSKNITEITDYMFNNCTSLNNVTLPAGVTAIGEEAFSGCKVLSRIELPVKLASIGANAFADDSSLQRLAVPSSVTQIGKNAFPKKIVIVCTIGSAAHNAANRYEAFRTGEVGYFKSICYTAYSTNMTDFFIPANFDGQSVYGVDEKVFEDNSKITSLTVEEGISNLKYSSFGFCKALTKVKLPKSIGGLSGTFRFCDNLETVEMPEETDSALFIGEFAFDYCPKLREITIPHKTESIGMSAFSGCSSLKSITIPDSCEEIGNWAFSNCDSLKAYYIPASVTKIGKQSLGYVHKSFESLDLVPLGGVVIYGESGSAAEQYAKDNGFEFRALKAVESLSLDKNELKLEKGDSEKLTYTVKSNLPYKGRLKWSTTDYNIVNVEDGVLTARNYGTATITLEAPGGFKATCKVTVTGSKLFDYEVQENGTLEITKYLGDSGEIVIPETIDGKTVTSIGYCLFYNKSDIDKTKITKVTLPGTINYISGYAFCNCANLESINIPDGVLIIGKYAFYGCKKLDVFPLPRKIRRIRDYAFTYCKRAEKPVALPDGLEIIGDYAFYDTVYRYGITVPASVTEIGKSAFGKYKGDDSKTYFYKSFPVSGYKGTAAEQYAKDNNFTFVDLNAPKIGDVDGNGVVDSKDRVILTRYIAKWKDCAKINETTADVNADGKINSKDRIILARYIAKWSGYQTLPHK